MEMFKDFLSGKGALNNFETQDTLVMNVRDCFGMKNKDGIVVGCVAVCNIERGNISLGDEVAVNGVVDVIRGIECDGKLLKSASSGMTVAVLLKNISKSELQVGDRICGM